MAEYGEGVKMGLGARAVLMWLVLLAAMFGNGTLRLTLAFEFLFGHFVSGMSWAALLADYDIRRGRLWVLVLLATLLAPWLWGTLRSRPLR